MNINIETNTTQTLTTEQVDILARDLCGVIITLSDTGVPKYNFTTTGISATCENVHQESVDALRLKGINVTYTNSYILFKDPEVVRVLTAQGIMQEGEGLTIAQANNLPTGVGSPYSNWWADNTTITSFDEIKYFGRLKTGAYQMGGWFLNATNLESVDLTGFTYLLGFRCFENCKNLKYFHGRNNTPNTLNLEDLINVNASFRGCLKLYHITSLGTVTGFWEMFTNCSNLQDVNLPITCISLNQSCFQNCSSLTTINIVHTSKIGPSVFEGCSSLEYCDGPNSTQGELNLPNLTGTLGNKAFKGCTKLTFIASLGSITSIGNNTFENCTSLATINTPSTVTSVGDSAFYGCSGLTSVTINATMPPTLGNNVFQNTNNCPIYVPAGSVSAYQSASGWSTYASRIQAIPTT